MCQEGASVGVSCAGSFSRHEAQLLVARSVAKVVMLSTMVWMRILTRSSKKNEIYCLIRMLIGALWMGLRRRMILQAWT